MCPLFSGGLRRACHGEDGNVVFLTEVLCCCGEGGCCDAAAQHFGNAIEAEEAASGVLRLGDAIGHEHERVARGKLEAQNREVEARECAER
jgi:hypothetical protein